MYVCVHIYPMHVIYSVSYCQKRRILVRLNLTGFKQKKGRIHGVALHKKASYNLSVGDIAMTYRNSLLGCSSADTLFGHS